jgi:hypothetical protein
MNFDLYEDPITLPEEPPAPKVDQFEDVYKGFAGGVGRGTSALLGLPGDVAEYGARGIDWASRKLGGILGVDVKERADQKPTYGSEDVQKAIESQTGEFYKPQTRAGKYASTAGEFLPGAALPGAGVGGVGRQIASRALNVVAPAIGSETAGQLTEGTPWEPWARVGGALAGGVAGARAVTPIAPTTPGRAAMVSTLDEAGIPMTAGQRTGSKALQYAEAAAADMPFSGNRAAQLNERTAQAFDRAVTERAFGPQAAGAEVAPNPRAIQSGRQALSNEYDRLSAGSTLRSDPQLQADMLAAERNYQTNVLPTQRAAGAQNIEQIRNEIVDRLVANQGTLPGAEYQAIRSRLGRQAQSAQADPELASALRDTRGALDRAMRRSLPAAEGEAWDVNRARWADMRRLEAAAAQSGEHVSPAAYKAAQRQGRSSQYARGQNESDELARAAAEVLKPIPQSGTAPRSVFSNIGQTIVGGAGLGGSIGATGGLPGAAVGAGTGALLGAAAPFVSAGVGRAVLSGPGQLYLGNRALPQFSSDVGRTAIAEALLNTPRRRGEAKISTEKANQERDEIFRQLGL